MNTKGASASGRARCALCKARGDIGVKWANSRLISPDIWRKQLLDYATLGPAYKYGGAFTGDELQIVDQKLDRYMARKAQRANVAFADRPIPLRQLCPHSTKRASNLLTRFGHSVYLFFMITPPESRWWSARGLAAPKSDDTKP